MLVSAVDQHESAIGMHISPPSWSPLPPPTPSHPSRLSQSPGFGFPDLYSKLPLAICFTYGKVYVSMLLSQFVPPSPSPTIFTSLFSMSVSPFMHANLLQLCLTLCDPMDCSPPGSSVNGILQARILVGWMLTSRGSSLPRDRTCISCNSCIAGGFFTTEPPGKPPSRFYVYVLIYEICFSLSDLTSLYYKL